MVANLLEVDLSLVEHILLVVVPVLAVVGMFTLIGCVL